MKLLNILWAKVYRRWLWDSFRSRYARVIRVTGWRTAIVEFGSQRSKVSPCFWWFRLLLLLPVLLCGCATQVYTHTKTGGTFYWASSVLMNDQVSKLAVDRTSPKTGYHQGIGIASLGLDVDNAAVEAITKGVVEGVIQGMKTP